MRRMPLLALYLAIGFTGTTIAGDAPRSRYGTPAPGAAHLRVLTDGTEVQVELASLAATLVGFEQAPQTDTERETLALAKDNLHTGDGMIRFNTQAACRLVAANIKTDFSKTATIKTSYRFSCDQPDRLDSAALGLFIGFPALRRVLVEYTTKDGSGAAELTPVNAVVTFVPLSGRQ